MKCETFSIFCQNMIGMQRLNDSDPPVLTSRLLLAPVTLPDMQRKEKGNHCNGQETTHHLSSSYSGENRPVFESSGGLQVNDSVELSSCSGADPIGGRVGVSLG